MYGHRVDSWCDEDFKSRGFMPAERTPINVNRFMRRKAEASVSWEEVDGVYRQVWDLEDCSEDPVLQEFALNLVATEIERRLSEIEGLRSAYPDNEEIKNYIEELKDLVNQPPQELAWAIEQGTTQGWPAKPTARSVMKSASEAEGR
jgi:hypothetical protein